MKKIVLLGDSIRQIGYGIRVSEMLGEEYEVYQPDDNCRFSKYTLLGCDDWREKMKGADLIHWNNGLWDVCNRFGDGAFTSEEEYIANMTRIAKLLLKITPNVIFATTTPVHEGQATIKNDIIKRYNEIIVPELKKLGVRINDLHAFVLPNRDKYVREDDKMHLTAEGIEATAELISGLIKSIV